VIKSGSIGVQLAGDPRDEHPGSFREKRGETKPGSSNISSDKTVLELEFCVFRATNVDLGFY